jgi:pyruvate kinase
LRRTRIIATLGPATDRPGVLARLFRAGADVARVNASHGTPDDHARRIGEVRKVEGLLGRPIPVLFDLSGPKIRTGTLSGGSRRLKSGDRIALAPEGYERPGDVPVNYPEVFCDVRPGSRILVDDGLLELSVERREGSRLRCRVVVGGLLKDHKGLNFPDVLLSIDALTPKDLKDLSTAVHEQVDYLAQSFVRSAHDVERLRARLRRLESDIPIIAKIEKPEAVDDIEAIVGVSDGIMVARGDLGVEVPAERVPEIQKRVIRRANEGEIPVITATQMLESMIEHARPTRAEASDVANAIFDGTDAVMLSGETASGLYPVEAVAMMAEIAAQAEASEFWEAPLLSPRDHSIPHAVAVAASRTADEVEARAIVCFTETGKTALLLSKFARGRPIFAISRRFEICRRMALYPGVVGFTLAMPLHTDRMISKARQMLLKKKLIRAGDRVVVVSGSTRARGATNLMKVETV